MMELIVAILITLGSMTQGEVFSDEYINRHETEISRAQSIIDHGQYRIDERTGGVIIDPGVGL